MSHAHLSLVLEHFYDEFRAKKDMVYTGRRLRHNTNSHLKLPNRHEAKGWDLDDAKDRRRRGLNGVKNFYYASAV